MSEERTTLRGKRFVVWGDTFFAKSISSSLKQLLGKTRVDLVQNEKDACEVLWQAGDSQELYDSTHLIFATAALLSCDQLFRAHCRFRPRGPGQRASLSGFGPGWSGGILFVGSFTDGAYEELSQLNPFNKIESGHAVLPPSCPLLKLLLTVAILKPVYPNQWMGATMAIAGLKGLRTALDNCAANPDTPSCLRNLLSALEKLLSDGLLNRLLAHKEVIGRLRDECSLIANAVELAEFSNGKMFATRVGTILADYI